MPEHVLDCFAHVHLMGQGRISGIIRTKSFGPIGLIEVTVPEIPSAEIILTETRLVGDRYYDAGTRLKIRRPGRTEYYGTGAIYAIKPCPEEDITFTELSKVQVLEVMYQPEPVGDIFEPGDPDDEDEELVVAPGVADAR